MTKLLFGGDSNNSIYSKTAENPEKLRK